jgi:hypothetical protein
VNRWPSSGTPPAGGVAAPTGHPFEVSPHSPVRTTHVPGAHLGICPINHEGKTDRDDPLRSVATDSDLGLAIGWTFDSFSDAGQSNKLHRSSLCHSSGECFQACHSPRLRPCDELVAVTGRLSSVTSGSAVEILEQRKVALALTSPLRCRAAFSSTLTTVQTGTKGSLERRGLFTCRVTRAEVRAAGDFCLLLSRRRERSQIRRNRKSSVYSDLCVASLASAGRQARRCTAGTLRFRFCSPVIIIEAQTGLRAEDRRNHVDFSRAPLLDGAA